MRSHRFVLETYARIEGKRATRCNFEGRWEAGRRIQGNFMKVHGKPLLLETSKANSEARSADKPAVTISNIIPVPQCLLLHCRYSFNFYPFSSASASLKMKSRFPRLINFYLMLTDSGRMSAWSRAPVTPQIILPQAHFTLFDRNICAKFLTLKSPLKSKWNGS